MIAGLRGEGTEPTLVLWALTKAMRDLWTGFEDRWSPKPLPLSERAVLAPLNFERTAVNGTNGHATVAASKEGRGAAK